MTVSAIHARDPLGPGRPPARVLTADRVFTGAGSETLQHGAVVVEDGLISWVGQSAQLPPAYAGLPQSNHPGATILPGLIETHAHLGSPAAGLAPDVPDPERHDQAWSALASVGVARQLASLGVTTVQSLGARHFTDVSLREAIRQGLVEGPRIVAAGPQLTTTGGHAWSTGGEVDSPTDIRRAVRDHHKAGVDLIKVMATGGFMTPRTAPWNAQFTTIELRELVEEAHRLGKHTAAHAHGTQGIARALEAGIDYIAHASFIDQTGRTEFSPRLAEGLAAAGTFVDTCSPPSWPTVPGETITPRAYELYQHGVQLVTGHDIGAVLPPNGYTFGLKQLAASGLPTTEVLLAATSRAAAAVGLAGVTGALVPGYAADLIVADGDPVADLDALDRLLEIVIAGRPFQPDPVPAFDPAHFGGPAGSSHPSDARAAWFAQQQRRRNHLSTRLTTIA